MAIGRSDTEDGQPASPRVPLFPTGHSPGRLMTSGAVPRLLLLFSLKDPAVWNSLTDLDLEIYPGKANIHIVGFLYRYASPMS